MEDEKEIRLLRTNHGRFVIYYPPGVFVFEDMCGFFWIEKDGSKGRKLTSEELSSEIAFYV